MSDPACWNQAEIDKVNEALKSSRSVLDEINKSVARISARLEDCQEKIRMRDRWWLYLSGVLFCGIASFACFALCAIVLYLAL